MKLDSQSEDTATKASASNMEQQQQVRHSHPGSQNGPTRPFSSGKPRTTSGSSGFNNNSNNHNQGNQGGGGAPQQQQQYAPQQQQQHHHQGQQNMQSQYPGPQQLTPQQAALQQAQAQFMIHNGMQFSGYTPGYGPVMQQPFLLPVGANGPFPTGLVRMPQGFPPQHVQSPNFYSPQQGYQMYPPQGYAQPQRFPGSQGGFAHPQQLHSGEGPPQPSGQAQLQQQHGGPPSLSGPPQPAGPTRLSAPTENAVGAQQQPSPDIHQQQQQQPYIIPGGGPPRYRNPGLFAPTVRQPTPQVNFVGDSLAPVGGQQQFPQQAASTMSTLQKRVKNVLTFVDPETKEAVKLPEAEKPEDRSSVAAAANAERRGSVDSGKGAAATALPAADAVSVSSDTEHTPQRKDSVSEDKAAADDVKAEFRRKVFDLHGNTGPRKSESSISETAAAGELSGKDEAGPTVVPKVATPPPPAARQPIVISAPPSGPRQVSGPVPSNDLAGRPAVNASSGETTIVRDVNTSPRKFAETSNDSSSAQSSPEVHSAKTTPAEPAVSPVRSTEEIKPAEPIQTTLSPVKVEKRESSEEHRQEPEQPKPAANAAEVAAAERRPSVTANGEIVDEMEALEEAAVDKPHLPGRLVYDRSKLLELERSFRDAKLSDDMKKKVDSVLKNNTGGGPAGGQSGNRGGPSYAQYGPPPPMNMGMPRVSSNRDMHGGGHGQGPAPRVITLNTSSRYEEMPVNENAWKPAHKRGQDDLDADEKTLASVRALLNKITPNNYEKLSNKMLEEKFTETPDLLLGAVDVIFDKALDELNYAEIYAKLCRKLIDLETKPDDNGRVVKFRTVLLQRAQHYFEKTDMESQEADKEDVKITAAEAEEKRVKAKRHYLGNIRFISELYRFEMLTDKVILSCFQRLLPKRSDFGDADEEKLECLCKLLMTCSERIKPDSAVAVQTLFDQLKKMIDGRATSSRIRFLMQDTIDLRKNNYVARKTVAPANVKPKTLQEIHEEKRLEELAIKNAVRDLPPAPRGQQQMQGGRSGGPMLQMQGGGMMMSGGMKKVSSQPGGMSSMQQQGSPQQPGRGGISNVSSGSVTKPSKFLGSLTAVSGGGTPFQLGKTSQWSKGSGQLQNSASNSRISLPQTASDRARMENRSATNSRENSMSRQGNDRMGPRGSLTHTPELREGTPILVNVEPTSGESPRGSQLPTPADTPLSRSPVNEILPDVTEDEVLDITKHLVESIKKSEGTDVQDVITDASQKLSRFNSKLKQQFVSTVFGHYYESKQPDRKPITGLLVGVAKEGRLPLEVLEESFAEQIAQTADQVMDVGPAYYTYVVALIGPLVVEGHFPVASVEGVFRRADGPAEVEKYQEAFRKWVNLSESVSADRRHILSSAPEWANYLNDPAAL
ncbi:putative Eukaryotic translation initiation factor 4 gamma 3 [Hypsibius exemplaris]|uniref:Eukaryotic translation initiation factor 4 gamma 3 n=1 Tax=Hypsibius exemplaris TaxID=2072580 RepID=A0A1W0WUA0_HYPEX|nr:putative Eukaryotic translation initiation factor 4 gamma 3 [Hypsibius exemplaris]